MANLGGFAGGLASGYMAGERMKLSKQEDKRADEMAQMRRTEFEFQQTERARERAIKDEQAAIFKKWQDGWEEDEPFQTTNDAGEVVQGVRKKMVKPDLNDPMALARMQVEIGTARARQTGDPAKMAEAYKYLQSVKANEAGNAVFNYLTRDSSEPSRVKAATALGISPDDFKVTKDKDNQPVVETGGKVVPLRPMLALVAGGNAYEAYLADQKAAQERRSSELGNLQKEAAIRQTDAQTNLAIPAQARQADAGAAASRARAGYEGEARNSLTEDRNLRAISGQVNSIFPPLKVKDPVTGTEQVTPSPAANYVNQIVLANPGKERAVAQQAIAAAQQVEQEARRRLTALRANPETYKQVLKNAKTDENILNVYMQDGLSKLGKPK